MPDPSAPKQLLLYRFDADAKFEGRLVGALERMESGGALRILEALFAETVWSPVSSRPSTCAAAAPGAWSCRSSTPDSIWASVAA